MCVDHESSQVQPACASVQNRTVSGRDDVWRSLELRIGIVQQLDGPVPIVLLGGLEQDAPDSPTVGDRPVEKPANLGGVRAEDRLADQPERGNGFSNLAISAVNSGNVAIRLVTTAQND